MVARPETLVDVGRGMAVPWVIFERSLDHKYSGGSQLLNALGCRVPDFAEPRR